MENIKSYFDNGQLLKICNYKDGKKIMDNY